jgi:hypothetical protein
MKTLLLLSCVLAALCAWALPGSAQAQRLSVTPAAGLWKTRQQLSLNGADLLTIVRDMQQKALAGLSPEERAAAERLMAEHADVLRGIERECISAEDARAMTDPQRLVAHMNAADEADTSQCRFTLVSVRGNTLRVKGRCAPEDGWAGDLDGEMTLHDARRWTTRFTGSGRMAGEPIPGVPGAEGRVDAVMQTTARWLQADCGSVPRRHR